MQLVYSTFYWLAYGITVGLVALAVTIFIFTFQSRRDRSALVSIITIISLTSILSTLLLLPVDVALVSSTNSSKLGVRKEWATPEKVQEIVSTLQILYIILYSVDAFLCLIVIPFVYFFYEEYDEVGAEEGQQTLGQRIFGALKYSILFSILLFVFFFAGFLVPRARDPIGSRFDLDFLKRLIIEDHGERALTFSLGLLISIGTLLYASFTAVGLAVLPLSLIRPSPSIDASGLHENTTVNLEQNRERQRQLQYRSINSSRFDLIQQRRERQGLINEEITLIRRKNLAAKLQGYGNSKIDRLLVKLKTVFMPVRIITGMFLLGLSIIIWGSILVTGIDKAKNSICKQHCGYILNNINIFQPLNYIFTKSAEIFPLDNIIMVIVVLFFFCSSIVGIARIGIRFFWVKLLEIRKGQTLPQAMLIISVMLALMVLALNYSITMMVAPQYATFGTQTFCDAPVRHLGGQPNCSMYPELVKPCSGLLPNHGSQNICMPSVISTALGQVIINFKFFGAFLFWAQFAFLATSLIAFFASFFRSSGLDLRIIDQIAENDEEERLLSNQR